MAAPVIVGIGRILLGLGRFLSRAFAGLGIRSAAGRTAASAAARPAATSAATPVASSSGVAPNPAGQLPKTNVGQPVQKATTSIEKEIEKIIDSVVRKKGEEILLKVIEHTPPFAKHMSYNTGGKVMGRKTAFENIMSDLNRIFKPVRSVPFANLVANKDWEAMAAYNLNWKSPRLQTAFNKGDQSQLDKAFLAHKRIGLEIGAYAQESEMRAIHQASRQPDGRTGYRNIPRLVKNQIAIKEYAKIVNESVGKMVGGWYEAAKQLGFTKIKKNPFIHNGAGSGKISKQKGGEYEMIMSNRYGDANKFLSGNLDCQALVDKAAKEIEAEVNIRITDLINSKLNKTP